MRRVASQLKEREFSEHLSEIKLALFIDNKLDEEQKEEVFKHLSQCKRCRDVLLVASQIKQEEERLKPANNTNYKGILKKFGTVAAIFVVFLAVPKVDDQFDTPAFKGFMEEKNIFIESIEYWEKLFEKLFGIE